MKALTLWQPWGSLIAIGAKPWEFRGWPPPASLVGAQMAVHAGARPVRVSEVKDLIYRLAGGGGGGWSTGLIPDLAIPYLEAVLRNPRATLLSHVVCTVRVGEPVPGWKIAEQLGGHVNDSDREEHSNWAWPMLEVQPLEPPEPRRGGQGLWNWP